MRHPLSSAIFVLGFLVSLILGLGGNAAAQTDEQMNGLCEKGNSLACFKVAEKFRTLDRDNKKALEYYLKSCDGGWITACNNAGILTQMQGQQYSKYWKKAAKLFQKGCEADESNACFNLGNLKYREGRASTARKYFKMACDLGNQGGCNNLDNLSK
ncbi:MAG: tetratricopeptide repeat protein [Nitrospinaceae bacterium]